MSHRKTAWSASSSLPSDRLAPRPSPSPAPKKPSNRNNNAPQVPLSPALKKLDALITSLAKSSLVDPDPKGGCFCQARLHGLSPYTPICAQSCGLVLCEVNSPAYSCPHCVYPLMTASEKGALVERLQEERLQLEEKERVEREREEEERRARVGAFPSLAASGSGVGAPVVAPVPTSHKVLSLSGGGAKGKGKKKVVTVSTITSAPAPTPEERIHKPVKEPEPTRVPPPLGVVPPPIELRDARRPFKNFRANGEWYVHPPQQPRNTNEGGSTEADDAAKKPRKRRGGKGKERVDGPVDDAGGEES